MKWQDLPKEKKQLVFLGALLLFGALFAAYQFVLAPYFSSPGRAASADDLDKLLADIRQADAIIAKDTQTRKELTESISTLQRALETYLAPPDNPLSWATEKIYRGAREIGIDIESVAEVGSGSTPWAALKTSPRMFVPYTVRIIMQCGYADALALVGHIEQANPYISITGISMVAQDRTPERHQISLIVEWPMQLDAKPKTPPKGPGARR